MAQFGIESSVDWECRVGRHWVLGSGSGAWGDFSGAMQKPSVGGACCVKGMAAGSGAGGGTQTITDCGAPSRGGSGYILGCCVSATNGKEGCAVVVGDGSFAGAVMATGSGAGGGTQTTDCGAHSRGGSGYSVGCCVSATDRKEGCAVVVGDGSFAGAGGIFSRMLKMCQFTCSNSRRARRSR